MMMMIATVISATTTTVTHLHLQIRLTKVVAVVVTITTISYNNITTELYGSFHIVVAVNIQMPVGHIKYIIVHCEIVYY